MTIEAVEELEYCKKLVKYSASPELIQDKKKEVLQKFRNHPVSGFRKGKASNNALWVKYKKQIQAEMEKEILSEAYEDIVFELGFTPVGYPQRQSSRLSGNTFNCELLFFLKPEFELKDYKYEIPAPHIDKTAVELSEEMLQNLRVQHGGAEPYGDDDFVKAGDKVTLSYEINIDGQEPIINEGDLYHVGSGILSTQFDDNILGMKPDDEREFTIVNGETTAHVKVKLFMGMRPSVCNDNAELAEKTGYESYEALREAIAGSASARIDQEKRRLAAEQVKRRLLDEHKFEVPEWLYSVESRTLAKNEGVEWDELSDDMKQKYIERACEQIRLSCIYDSIREVEPEAQMSDEEIRNYLVNVIQMRGQDPQQVLVEAERSGQLLSIIAGVRNEMTIQYLAENCKFVE